MSKVRVDNIADLNDDAVINVVELVNRVSSSLGPKAVAPTVRNNGSALVAGDTYFDTATLADMTYISGSWKKTVTLADIIDTLTSTDPTKVLSAKQGKVLSDNLLQVDALARAASMPIGMTFPWSLSEASIPAGTIPRNGQLLDRAVWPQLWALVSSQAVSDAVWLASPYLNRGQYSSGNGTTTFRMPDDNGKYADGLGVGAVTYRGYGKNSAGTVGTHQADQMQGHFHSATYPLFSAVAGAIQAGGAIGTNTGGSITGPITDGTNGTPRVGSETRMANGTVIWVTVAANSTVNSGAVDVTALATSVSTQSSRIATIEAKQMFTKEYISPQQTIVNSGGITLAHGLGAKPKLVKAYVVCTVATGNWAVGDETFYELDYEQANASLVIFGFTCKRDATNLIIRFAGSGIFLHDPVTAALVNSPTVATNFKIVFEAWA